MDQRKRVSDRVVSNFPLTFGTGKEVALSEDVEAERTRLIESILDHAFDGLLPHLLRKQAFVELYLLTVSGWFKRSGQRGLVSALRDIIAEDHGAVIFGDVANLKIANNESRARGDWMLGLIASAVHRSELDLYGRFREGDEFIAYARDVNHAHSACDMILREVGKERIQGLPIRVDFGVVSHEEVAQTFLALLSAGWQIPEGKLAEQVFFDIALEIAEVRSSVVKIYERALLLTALLRSFVRRLKPHRVFSWWKYWSEYRDQVNLLVRGGKFVQPSLLWLFLGRKELEVRSLRETLALLEADKASEVYGATIVRAAHSIYKDVLFD